MTALLARYPGEVWDRIAVPEDVGWSSQHLHQAQTYAQAIGSAAVAVVPQGGLPASWGEVAQPFNLRSIRKSVLSCLYGIVVQEGKLRLSMTLGELGIDDQEPSLTTEEKQATVADLLTSRSGVWHSSNHQGAAERAGLPPRGSHAPGTFWYYNNWDFNALGPIYEQCTQTRIFEAFERQVALPLQMEDFALENMLYDGGPHSIHPAYFFRMSAWDLARFGLLYLRHGRWRQQHIVPGAWVEESTKAHVTLRSGAGYGYMWWATVNGKLLHPRL